MSTEKLVIIGSGPAGYTAAIYAARATLNPVMIEGQETGGQLMWTTEVENFPGFPKGILGPELMKQFKDQAIRFGTRFVTGAVTEVDFSTRPFSIKTDQETFLAEAVIIATGSSARWLEVPGEQEYKGKGVSACATCDGFFFKDKEVIVVGGGDAAMEEANFLTRFATKVTVLVRGDKLRASEIMEDRAKNNPKIGFVWNTVVKEVLGDGQKMTGIKIVNNQTNEESELKANGLFVAVGHKPNTDLFKGQIEVDNVKGYIIVNHPSTSTSVEGVFAAGDVADFIYRQAVTAAGSGCRAALDAERFLERNKEK